MADYKYDAVEATFLVNDYAEQIRRSREAATKAAVDLLGDLLKLMQTYGFQPHVEAGTNNVEFTLAGRVVMVGLDGEGLFVQGRDGTPVRVRVVYDRATQMLRSTEKDTFRASEPGKPIPYRSALAELAHATIARMNQK